jgi:hypothetical protein
MFPFLPEELERMIWTQFRSRFVFRQIRDRKTIWCSPSKNLLVLTREIGAIQVRCTDFERILHKGHMKWYYDNLYYQPCLRELCINCVRYGFPCESAVHIGNMSDEMLKNWKF